MRIESLLVANAAEVRDGLLYVSGAGWETFGLQIFPNEVRGYLTGIAVLDEEEFGEMVAIQFSVSDQAGHVAGSAGSIITSGIRARTPGVPIRFPFVIPFVTVVTGPTIVDCVLSSSDGSRLASLNFSIPDPVPDSLEG